MFDQILVFPLFNLLTLIYAVLPIHDFGLAIIIFTALVRLALWPLVNKQLHSQRVMQQLAPEVAKIKTQAAGDRQKESQMLMELYKQKGINPFASFGPLLIQMPIFFALFYALMHLVEAGKIASLSYSWVKGLPAIQAIISGSQGFHPSLFGLVDLSKPSIALAVLAAAVQYFQSKQLTPKKGSPNAAQMNMMTMIIPVIVLISGITLPGAMSLYWFVTSAIAILQQHLVLRRDVEEMDPSLKTGAKK